MRLASATQIATWIVLALAAVLTVFLLLNSEYRHAFLTGSGIAEGALIAAVALGVLLTYRGSGVVNFANGAVAMYVAYVYAELRNTGKLFLPPLPNPLSVVEGAVHLFQSPKTFKLPDIPTEIKLSSSSMSFWPALLISLAFCVLLGLAFHFLVFRPLRYAPPLAKVVASIGVFILLQAIVVRRFNTTPQTVRRAPFLKKTEHVNLGFIKLNQEQLFVAILVIVITAVLWLLFQKTRFGLATRAAAENEKGAVVLGFSPDFLAGTNWVLSTVITGLLGIFVATSLSTIEPTVLPALIVPALTAALVGSFTSFPRTVIAAFVLGMQTPLVGYLGFKSWFPKSGTDAFPGVDRLLPLLVIVLVLYLLGNTLPTRGAITLGRLPFSPTPPTWAIRIAGPVLIVVTAVLGLYVLDPAYRGGLANTLVGTIICLSVVVITGFVGQISLAQMAFAGISAFLVSHLSTEHGWPFPWPIFAGAFVALIVGVLLALPALRVRGVNLAIITFAFAVAVDDMIFKNTSVNGGFRQALVKAPTWIDPNVGKHKFLGFTVGDGTLPNPTTAIFCLIVVAILCYLVANIRRSTTGRQMLAMRANERAAAAAGVNVSATKALAFAISAFIAGIGGAVIAYRSGNATETQFAYITSLVFFAFAYLGGISSVTGALAGGFLVPGGLVFTFLSESMHVSSQFTLLLGGLGLVLTAILNPEGVAGSLRELGLRIKHAAGGRRAPADAAPKPAVAAEQGAA